MSGKLHLVRGEQDGGAARADDPAEALVDERPRDVRVHCRERVVEEEDARPAVHGASERDARPLPARHRHAALADQAVGSNPQLVGQQRAAADHLLVPRLVDWPAHQDVVAERGVDDPRRLRHVPDARLVGREGHSPAGAAHLAKQKQQHRRLAAPDRAAEEVKQKHAAEMKQKRAAARTNIIRAAEDLKKSLQEDKVAKKQAKAESKKLKKLAAKAKGKKSKGKKKASKNAGIVQGGSLKDSEILK